VETIRWFLDGAQYHSVSQDQLDPTTWANATQHGYFLMYDLAMGGAFPAAFGGGPTAATVSGGEMVIDYVAVYSGGRGGPTPTPTSTPTPTGGPTPTPTPTPTSGGGVPATSTIQAESFAAKSARPQTEPTADAGGGLDVGSLGDGDWMQYNDVDFGSTPLTQFNARAASGAGGGISGLVEVHLDSRSSPSIGSFAIASTGGWQSWRTVPANMAPTTGRHTVFIEFVSGSGQVFVSVNWLTFSP